ncbi:recombinase family protein [Rhodococcus qingshengii]|uniref:recombinase family protein n=1 Tax=Rhodococcus qingshengii TaxID=334542 RepID=UPI0018DACF27|nr:recombinase family protein [Rhodococcus qingshengii]QPG90942.1 recombinase family protein [Rhodococcus qingshengii]
MTAKQAPTRAIIYVRVSQDSSRSGRSVAEQEADCRAVCLREGWPVGEVLEDNDIGASRWSGKDRPAYRRLAEVLRPGDVLVTWEASRAQRDLTAYAELRDLCAALGVFWNYKGRTHDLNLGTDRFSTGLDALMAEKEADETRDRVVRALKSNAAQGKPHGKHPYGYRGVRDARGNLVRGEREIEPASAEFVREMVGRVLDGETLRSIAKDVGPRAGEEWRPTSLAKMLKNPALAGWRVHNGEKVRGTWEPILTEDEHMRVVAVLDNPQRRTNRGTAPKFLLSGIAVCDVCGSFCYRRKQHTKGSYQCVNFHVARNVERADAVVIEKMLQLIRKYQEHLFLFSDDEGDEVTGDSARYLAEADELQQRLDGYTDAAMRGEMSQKQYLRMEAGLIGQIERAQQKARESTLVSDPILLRFIAKDPLAVWEDATLEEQRRIVRASVNVRIKKTGRVFNPDDVEVTWKTVRRAL